MGWRYLPERCGTSTSAQESGPWRSESREPDTGPAATVRSSATVSKCSSPGCATEACTALPCGRTSATSTGVHGLEWISCRQGGPANLIPSQANGKEPPTTGTSGPRLSGSFARYDRELACWKTFQASLPLTEGECSDECSETWPSAGCV